LHLGDIGVLDEAVELWQGLVEGDEVAAYGVPQLFVAARLALFQLGIPEAAVETDRRLASAFSSKERNPRPRVPLQEVRHVQQVLVPEAVADGDRTLQTPAVKLREQLTTEAVPHGSRMRACFP
jgi:hypothetical protein